MEAVGKPSITETAEWQIGKTGEEIVKRMLTELGWTIVPTSQVQDQREARPRTWKDWRALWWRYCLTCRPSGVAAPHGGWR